MTMGGETRDPRRAVAVLDIGGGGRQLVDAVVTADLDTLEVRSLDELIAVVAEGKARVALVAFEALWPQSQQNLVRLREASGSKTCRLVVAYPRERPRLRLGRKLWSVGLIDHLVARADPPRHVAALLRQSLADVVADEAPAPDTPLGVAHRLCGALTNRGSVEALLRELALRLAKMLPLRAIQVLVVPGGAKLYIFQTCAVDHEVRLEMARRVCDAVSPLAREGLAPEDLVFVDSPPIVFEGQASAAPVELEANDDTVLTCPLVHSGDLVGCVGLLLDDAALSTEQRLALRVVMLQLATSIRYADAMRVAERNSHIDELTGVANRRFMSRTLTVEWRRARRYGHPLTVALLDVDRMGEINETRGYTVGDAVLRRLATLLRQSVRDTDHVIRYGGDQLMVLLPETGPGEAVLVLERFTQMLRARPLEVPVRDVQATAGGSASAAVASISLSLSTGVAGIPLSRVRFAEELADLAEQALAVAKRGGRGRICLAHRSGVESIAGSIERPEKRRSPRVGSTIGVRYLELADFGGRALEAQSSDISAGGIAIRSTGQLLRRHSFGLVFLEGSDRPVLSQVVWTRDVQRDAGAEGERHAGLRFIRGEELSGIVARGEAHRAPGERLPRALVVAEHARTNSMARRVLTAARYSADFYSIEDALEAIEHHEYDVVVIGESLLASRGFDLVRETTERGGRVVLVNEHADRSAALEQARRSRIEHFVGYDASSEEALFATLNKLVLGEYFGLRKYLSWGSEPLSWPVDGAPSKDRVLDGIRALAKEVCCHPRITDLLISAVDEMIVNALYHDADTAKLEEATLRPVTVEAGSDGRFLAVAVLDEHGTFRPDQLFASLGRAVDRERYGLPSDASSASLGFRIMLGALSQLAINVEAGRRTEIIGIVDLRKSLREYRSSVPSFGIFERPGQLSGGTPRGKEAKK
ncbi:MAG: diguanylate cyclase [Myxococcales bacterium]|nr:diguanylate cyclase [Myxococcales bacterium]